MNKQPQLLNKFVDRSYKENVKPSDEFDISWLFDQVSQIQEMKKNQFKLMSTPRIVTQATQKHIAQKISSIQKSG